MQKQKNDETVLISRLVSVSICTEL